MTGGADRTSQQAAGSNVPTGNGDGNALSLEWEQSIQRLLAEYWLRVDYRDTRPPEDLFTEDCQFHLGNLTFQGRPALSAFFRKRSADQAATARTTRHFCTNFLAQKVGTHRARVSTTVQAFAGFGDWPIATGLPSIADFEDFCVLLPDGSWLFESRTATSIFAGPQAPSFAQAPDGRLPAEDDKR